MTIHQCENCENNMKTHCFLMSGCFMNDNRHCLFQDSAELRRRRWEQLGKWGRFKVNVNSKWEDFKLDLFWVKYNFKKKLKGDSE